jgi:hypothetical protein
MGRPEGQNTGMYFVKPAGMNSPSWVQQPPGKAEILKTQEQFSVKIAVAALAHGLCGISASLHFSDFGQGSEATLTPKGRGHG